MTSKLKILSLAAAGFAAIASAVLPGNAQNAAPAKPSPELVEAYVKATFGKAPAEWQARLAPDDTLKACNAYRNDVPSAEANKITERESARVPMPADGKFLGDWKEGRKVANNGRGGQFSDDEKTVAGGNCYACHQLEKSELSYGTIGPSLTSYGKDRKYDPDDVKRAYIKIYDSQAQQACSNMPRFGVNKHLSEQQIKDLVALLFDPESPVNK
jgi:sulfur-oxidizing protein SoxX